MISFYDSTHATLKLFSMLLFQPFLSHCFLLFCY